MQGVQALTRLWINAEVDAHQAREVLGAVERRSARVEKVGSVVAKRLGTHAAGGVLRARLHKWHRASETSKVSEQVSLRQVAASRWLARTPATACGA